MADKNAKNNLLTYQQIKVDLEQLIENEWLAGQRLPPIKRLAEQLSVGQSNLNRAIRELVRQGLLVSRPGLGTYVRDPNLHPEPTVNFDGKCLARKQIIILRSSNEGFLDPIIEGFQSIAATNGAHVVEKKYNMLKANNSIKEHTQFDAVVMINPAEHSFIQPTPQQPLVIIATGLCQLRDVGGYDIVYADGRQGGVLAGRYAAEGGYECPCFIGVKNIHDPLLYDDISIERLHGFEAGLGRQLEEKFYLRTRDFSTEGGARAVKLYLRVNPKPDLIFAASDDIAVGFVHGALAHGMEPGEDYQLMGFDGQMRGKQLLGGPLTTVDIPSRDMGRAAAQLLAERLIEPNRPARTLTIAGQLYEGRTTRPPAQQNSSASPSKSRKKR